MIKNFTYYCPENTGWSNGVSWFLTFGTTYDTLSDAKKANEIHKRRYKSTTMAENVKYRIVKVTEIREVIEND